MLDLLPQKEVHHGSTSAPSSHIPSADQRGVAANTSQAAKPSAAARRSAIRTASHAATEGDKEGIGESRRALFIARVPERRQVICHTALTTAGTQARDPAQGTGTSSVDHFSTRGPPNLPGRQLP